MEDADEAMCHILPAEGLWQLYPPLPPYSDRDVRLEETTTRPAVIQCGESRTSRQVEALAHHSAAVQQQTAEQLGHVQRQQDRLAAQTSDYLQAQHDRQSEPLEQQKEMKRQMDEHRQYLDEQYRLLRAAEEAVGLQGQRLESLAEAVQPHLQARWGAFAQGAAPIVNQRPPEVPSVTVAAGTNLPVPPIYRGSSKKEKRDFMDSYAIYSRRIQALNQGTQTKIFVMPLSACIEQGTMVRICQFELFNQEKDVTESEWRDYFLSARIPDNTAYKTLDREVKNLCIDTNLQDAESRLSRLMADFYEIVDKLNMDDMVQAEPKKVVGYLVEALKPPAFKASVKDQLGRQSHKATKSNIQLFLKWFRKELESFMQFEAHIANVSQERSAAKSDKEQKAFDKSQKNRGWQNSPNKTRSNSSIQTVRRADQPKRKQELSGTSGKPDRKCFKCGDLAHGVFQCPNISGPAEAKELYEKTTGKQVVKPVLAAIPAGKVNTTASPAIPCIVMGTVETEITPDSAAEVSVVTTKLLKRLSVSGAWIPQQDLPGKAAVTGIGDRPVPVTSKVKLDLRFSTPGGPLVLENVICWVTDQPLPPGVGDLMLSCLIRVRLGYSSDKLLAVAQQMQSVWDMSDVTEETTRGMASVLAYSGQLNRVEPAEEELNLQEDEDQICFPTFTDDMDTERGLIKSILLEKAEEARRLGASLEFVEELKAILMEAY